MIRTYDSPEDQLTQAQDLSLAQRAPALENPSIPTPNPNTAVDILMAPFRGVEQAARGVYNLVDTVTLDALPDWHQGEFTLGRSETTAGKLVEGVSQFLVGFVPGLGVAGKAGSALGWAGKAGSVAQGALAGAIADFTVFDGQEKRLSNLIQEYPALRNPITDYLAADDDDGEIEGRFKNALEGLGIGAVADGLVHGLKAYSKYRSGVLSGLAKEEAAKLARTVSVEPIENALKRAGSGASDTAGEAATDSIKKLARLDIESGHLFQSPDKEISRVVDSSEDLAALLEERARFVRERDTASGKVKAVESLEETRAKSLQVIQDMTGRSTEAVFAHLRGGLEDTVNATYKAQAASELMVAVAQEAKHYAELVAKGQGTEENMLRSLSAQEKLAELISIVSGYGTAQGRALRARRYIKQAEISSVSMAKQLVQDLGGTGYISSQLQKIAAASPEGVGKLVSNQLTWGGRLLRAHNEYWVNAILSGPKTTIVNTLGNALNTLYLPMEGIVGALASGDTKAASSFARQYVYMAESVKDAFKFAGQAFMSGEGIIESGRRGTSDIIGNGKALSAGYLAQDASKVSTGLRSELQAGAQDALDLKGSSLWHFFNAFGEAARLPSRFLTGTDEFFRQINTRGAAKAHLYHQGRLQGLSGAELANFIDTQMSEAIRQGGSRYSEAALAREAEALAVEKGLGGLEKQQFIEKYLEDNYDESSSALSAAVFGKNVADEATFQRELGKAGKAIQSFTASHPIAQVFLPFVRTPTNILKFIGQRTAALTTLPIPGGGNLHLPILSELHARHALEIASADPLVRSQARGRTAMGLGIFAMASTLWHEGRVTGKGPDNLEERNALLASGWQPYSLVFDGPDGQKTYVSYQRLDPFAGFLGIVADWNEVGMRQETRLIAPQEALMGALVSSLAANLTNRSYLVGVTQLLNALNQPDRFAPRLLQKQAASYIPAFINQVGGALDGDDAIKEIRTMQDAIYSRLPGNPGGLEPRRNLLGEPVDSMLAQTPWAAVNPFVMSRTKDDRIFAELAQLNHGFKNPPVAQGPLSLLDYRSAKGQTAYDRWSQLQGEVKVGGKNLRQALEKLIDSRGYQALGVAPEGLGIESPRVSQLRRIIGVYRRAAYAQTLREYPELRSAVNQVKAQQLALKRTERGGQIAALIGQ